MAENVELELILKGGAKSVQTLGELEEGLAQAREEIKGLAKGSEDFNRLATAIQEASSEIKTLEKQMEGLEPQQKAEAFLKMGEGIAGGFAVAQGALALVGVESEELEKIQVKVQAAISIAMGVRMMSEAALMATTAKRVVAEKLALAQTKVATVVTKVNAAATTVAATAQRVFTGAVNTTTVSLKALKVAIMATGIGALVVAIGAIGKAVYDWATATDEVTKSQANLNRELADQNDEFKKNLKFQDELAAANTDAERELVKLQNRLSENNIKLDENSDKLRKNADDLENLGDFSKESQQIIQDNTGILEQNSTTLQNNIILLREKIKTVQNEIQAEKEKEKKDEENKRRSSQRSSERKQKRKQEAEQLRTLEQEIELLRIEDDDKRAEAKIEQDRKNALRAIEGAKNFKEQEKLINEKFDKQQADLFDQIVDRELEKFNEGIKKRKEEREKEQQEIKTQREKDAADALALEEAVTNAKKQMQENLLSAGAALFEKNKKISKGIAVAQTVFSTQQAVMDALAAKGTDALLPFPIRLANAIAAGAMGAASVRNILSENIGTVSAAGGESVTDTPQMIPASTGAFELGNIQQEPVKAFVVESEITDSQAQMADINRRSTI